MQYILNSDGSVSRQKKKKNETPTATQKSNNKMTGTEALATVGKTIGNVATNMGTGALRTMESTADFVSDKVANPTERKLNYYYDYLTKGKKVANENLKDLIEMQERDIKKDRTAKFLEDVGYNDVVDKWEQGSLVNRNNFGGKVAQGIGGMVPSLVVGGAVGSKAALTDLSKLSGKQKALAALGNVGKTYKAQLPANLILGASSYGSGMEEALNEGATMEQARKFGLANALIEQGTEMITGGVPGLGGKGGIDGLIDPLIDKGSKGFTKAALKTLYRAGGEGLEEAAAEMLNPLAKKTYSDEPIDWGQTAKNAWEAAKIGAVTGAALGGSQTAADFQRAQLENNMRKLPNLNDVERNALVELTIKRKSGQQLTEEDLGTIQYLNQKTSQMQEAQTTQQQPIQEAQTTQQAQPVQETTEQVEEKPRNVGIHYGDLGKAQDTYYSNVSGSRGTGHLGTGTYFVSENYKPSETSTYAKRPSNEVSFDDYNLYKPSTDREGYDLHDGLKAINSKSLFNKEQVSNIQEKYNTYLKDLSEKSVNDLINTLDEQGYDVDNIKKDFEEGWSTRAENNLRDMAEDIINDYDQLYKSYNNMVEQIKKNNPNISDKVINKAFEKTNKTLESYKKKGYKYGQYPTPNVDSLSTVFMKNLGYEGVDVRHLKGLDDTTYGSVIYDLKNKEKETAGVVRDAYKDIQNKNVKATIAPYYNTPLTKQNYTKIKNAVDESFRNTANDIATLMGGNIKETTNNIGGFTFEEGETAGSWVRELSYTFELENMSKEDATLFTSLMGDLGHEQQEAVIAATYEDDINNSNAVEFRLNYKNREQLSKALDDLGIHDYTIDTNNKQLKLLEFDDLNNPVQTAKKIVDVIEKLGGDLSDAEYSGIQSEYITKGDRERTYKTWLETNKRSEENRELHSLVEQAYKKVKGSIEEEGTSDSSFSNEKLPDKNVTFEDINFEENGSEGAKPVEVLGEMPKKERLSITQKAKKYANEVKESGSFLRRKFVDKLQSVDMLDRENNRKDNLYAEADRTHRSVAEAQYSIGDEQIDTDGNEYKNFTDKSGKKVSKSLIGIFDEVEKYGMNMKEFNEYLIDYLNLDRYDKVTEDGKSKAPRGLEYTKEMSEENIKKFEEKHPEAKRIAENVWQYSYNELDNRVKNGVMTKKQAENYKKETPHYVPISRDVEGYQSTMKKIDNRLVVNNQNKKIKGDSTAPILPIREAMAWNTVLNRSSQRINNAIKAVAQRYDAQDTNLSYSDSDLNINQDNVAVKSKDGKYYLTYFDGGKAKTFQVDKGMYEAFLPDQVYEWEKFFKIPATVDSFRKKLITDYNIKFLKNNAIKDVQDAMINTQYPKEFLGKYMDVATRLKNKNPDAKMQQYINEFKKSGGFSETYFADREFTSQKTKNPAKKALQMLNRANEYIELTPRLTEYILSREHGESVSVALHNAADVTTNFARGGVWAKKMNKWGFTFLNPSIQGADKAIRNLDPRNPRRFASVVARGALLGIGCGALNEALWNSGIFDKMPWGDDDDDDDGKKEYENLNEYIKNNYYIIPDKNGKPNIRIPKGRMMSVLQSIGRRGYKTAKGDGKFTENFKDLPSYAWGQVGPADPGNNNVFAPLIQAARNKSWSGNPIDSEYEVKNVAPEERYSVKTTSMAKKLGKALNISPKRIDYVFDQYSGAIGDLVIPMTNQYAETSSDNKFLEGLGAVFGNDMNLDPTFSNKQLGELYDNSNKYNTLTKEEKKKYKNEIGNKYLNEKIGEISEYNQQIKDIQASKKSNKEKMKETKELQKKINEIAEDANKTYKNVKKEGKYAATVGDSVYAKDSYGKWKKESDKTKEKRQSLGLDIEDYYYYKKEEAYTKPDGYQTSLVDGDKAKDKIALVDVFDFDPSDYLEYSYKINKIKAGKDTQRQVIEYIDSLPISAVQKAALYKKKYRSYKDYDRTIYNYIDNSDLTVQEKESLANFLKIK